MPRRSAARRSTAWPASRRRASTATELEDVFVENLKYAAPRLEQAGIRLLIEAINTRDIPGFFLTNSRARRWRSSTASARTTSISSTTSTTCRSWRGISPGPSRQTSAASRISSLRTIPAATSRGRARSTIHSSTSTSTASAMPAGSARNTSRRRAPRLGWGGSGQLAGQGSAAA